MAKTPVEACEFLTAIKSAPADLVLRGVYADWLEENGRPEAEVWRWLNATGRIPLGNQKKRIHHINFVNLWAWGGFRAMASHNLPRSLYHYIQTFLEKRTPNRNIFNERGLTFYPDGASALHAVVRVWLGGWRPTTPDVKLYGHNIRKKHWEKLQISPIT